MPSASLTSSRRSSARRPAPTAAGTWHGCCLTAPPKTVSPGGAHLGDITERKQAEAALRQANEQLHASEERLRFAPQAASFGCYDLDLVTDQAYRSPEFKSNCRSGTPEEFQVDADHLPVYLHPDDRASVRKAVLESRDPQGIGTEDLEYQRQGPCSWRISKDACCRSTWMRLSPMPISSPPAGGQGDRQRQSI